MKSTACEDRSRGFPEVATRFTFLPSNPHHPEMRRKSFEAEDGPALMRSLSIPASSRFRLEVTSKSRNDVNTRGASSTSSLYDSRRLFSVGDEDFLLHHSTSDSTFFPESRDSDVKRNHSLKVSVTSHFLFY